MAGEVHGGGHAWQGHAWQGGVCGTYASLMQRDMVGQCAGGTHPTGMHSCNDNEITDKFREA